MARHLLSMSATQTRKFGDSERSTMESEFYLEARREWDERYGDLVLGKTTYTTNGMTLVRGLDRRAAISN